MPKLKRNRVQCTHCEDIIESTHRHDFKFCSCGNTAVDGGLDYVRRLWKVEGGYKELSEYEEDNAS